MSLDTTLYESLPIVPADAVSFIPPLVPRRILVVEDYPPSQKIIRQCLCDAGYDVQIAGTGAQAIDTAITQPPDLVFLDLLLPDIDGLSVCGSLRRMSAVPILVLSGVTDGDRKAALLDAGADDYLLKPIGMHELLARIRVAFRHVHPPSRTTPCASVPLVLGTLMIDFPHYQITRNDQPIHLSPTEWAVLRLLASIPGRAFSYAEIAGQLWHDTISTSPRVLHTVISQLRNRLGAPSPIETIRGYGYRLQRPLTP